MTQASPEHYTEIEDYLRLVEATKTADADALRRALRTALDVIGNYRMDIRDGIENGHVADGYCQGSMYLGAYRIVLHQMLYEPAATKPTPDPE